MTANDSTIVYVHGISEHKPGYSAAWHASLEPHLSHPAEKHEVAFGDIVDALSIALGTVGNVDAEYELKFEAGEDDEASSELLNQEGELRDEINDELASRAIQNRQSSRKAAESCTELIGGEGGFSVTFDNFARYLIWDRIRNGILARFDEVVLPPLRDGRAVNIIAHSWGSVVAYEGLRRLDEETFPGRVANLIVLGSPLSIGPVQRNLFDRVGGGRRPKLVEHFVNVAAGGDVVGGSLAPAFDISDQFLRQPPTGCATFFLRRRVAKSFVCAHSSYFNQDNVAVNRDIIARCINTANPHN